jgi:hypothetical protein
MNDKDALVNPLYIDTITVSLCVSMNNIQLENGIDPTMVIVNKHVTKM